VNDDNDENFVSDTSGNEEIEEDGSMRTSTFSEDDMTDIDEDHNCYRDKIC